MRNNIIFILIVTIITINAIGFLIKYFGLDTYFILLGFRFQLSLCLPVFFILGGFSKDFIKNIFRNPFYKKNIFFIYLLTIPLLSLFLILFLLNKIEFGDPEYFYEFGVSSVIDFPVYLLWNSIQLTLFLFFLIYVVSRVKFKFLIVFFVFIFLFVYEIIPIGKESFDYYHLTSLIFFAIITGFTVKYYQNIYWLVIYSFSLLWLSILLFGSNSQMIINLLFASQYNAWEGFFSVSKDYKAFVLPALFLLVNLMILINLFIRKSKSLIDKF